MFNFSVRQHGVDFCFECNEYPCDKQFEGRTREKWLERNNRMKKIGLLLISGTKQIS